MGEIIVSIPKTWTFYLIFFNVWGLSSTSLTFHFPLSIFSLSGKNNKKTDLTLKIADTSLTLWMFSEVIALELLALVKKTHTPVSATSLPSVTNTLAFLLLRADCWGRGTGWGGTGAAAAAAEDRK